MQIIKIPKISDSDLLNFLIKKTDCTETEAKKAVSLADGNYKEAIKYLDKSDEEEYNFTTFIEWMRLCFKIDNKMSELDAFINKIPGIGRERQKNFLFYGTKIIRDSLLLNQGNDSLVPRAIPIF